MTWKCGPPSTRSSGDFRHIHLPIAVTKTGKNYEKAENPDLRSALKYIQERIAEGEFAEELDEEVKRVKEQRETRRETMTLEMEIRKQREDAMAIGVAKGKAEGEAEGRAEEKTTAALKMLRDHMPMAIISKYTELPVEAIKKLDKQDKLV